MTRPPDDELDHIRVFLPEEEEDLDVEPAEQEPRPPISEVIATLIAGEYPRSMLVGLSDLTAREAALLDAAWPSVAPQVRQAVASELNDLAEERVDYVFGRALLTMIDDPEPGVRQLAIAGLWELDDDRFADTLLAVLANDPSEDVRAEAARGLGRFAEMHELGEVDETLGERVSAGLLSVLADESEPLHVRARALESVSVRSNNDAVEQAIERFYDEDDSGYRATAIFAMGRSMNREFVPRVLNETASDDAEVRYEAARAAGRLGDTSALPVLADLADDEDAEVRQASINALGEIGGKAAVRYLRRIAESAAESDLELIEEALEEASSVGDPLMLDDDD